MNDMMMIDVILFINQDEVKRIYVIKFHDWENINDRYVELKWIDLEKRKWIWLIDKKVREIRDIVISNFWIILMIHNKTYFSINKS